MHELSLPEGRNLQKLQAKAADPSSFYVLLRSLPEIWPAERAALWKFFQIDPHEYYRFEYHAGSMGVAPFAGVEPPNSTCLGALLTKLAPMLRRNDESRRIARDFILYLFFLFLECAETIDTYRADIYRIHWLCKYMWPGGLRLLLRQ